MGTFKIFRQNDKISAAAEAGEFLNQALIEHKKKPVLLMLSGGSAFEVLDYVGQNALSENLTVSVLDERFSGDASINNFAQLQKTDFYKDALEADAGFFGTLPRVGETINNLEARWEANLKKWREENSGGIIMATLGMGTDGHTGGIFPEDDNNKFNALFNSGAWVTAYNAGDKNQFSERITTTLTFLRMVDFAYVLVCGQDKKQKLDEVINKKATINELPALAWYEVKDVKVFTDLK